MDCVQKQDIVASVIFYKASLLCQILPYRSCSNHSVSVQNSLGARVSMDGNRRGIKKSSTNPCAD